MIGYITVVAAMEERTRKCYAEPIDLSSNEFVIMMVVDGCFLIELTRYHETTMTQYLDTKRILSQLRHDVFLLENQLPFFLLKELFNMTKIDDPEDDIITLTLRFADSMFLNFKVPDIVRRIPTKDIDHIFSLVHCFLCLPFAESISAKAKHGRSYVSDNWTNIYSVSGLRETGIKIGRAEENNSLMDITLKNGFRGIIENCFGDDENVCLMFNRIGKNILTSPKFSYSQIFRDTIYTMLSYKHGSDKIP
ncbi:hypothetical protein CDL12_13970 [Handroanthus impetiginosus]|uniref:Uncharacterized protein n=1 Tax=Handroanthus impetiginosus TaxID=429701 RepID=A0A2G9H7A2_9LAMI|nr:hypothetical protein CDL12_13970 [Handroanthus impetiginosus]